MSSVSWHKLPCNCNCCRCINGVYHHFFYDCPYAEQFDSCKTRIVVSLHPIVMNGENAQLTSFPRPILLVWFYNNLSIKTLAVSFKITQQGRHIRMSVFFILSILSNAHAIMFEDFDYRVQTQLQASFILRTLSIYAQIAKRSKFIQMQTKLQTDDRWRVFTIMNLYLCNL